MIIESQKLRRAVFVLMPIVFALLAGAVLILLSGNNPLAAYGSLFSGAFIGRGAFANTLFNATPLIVTGLAITVAFKANLFNMGVEGQMYVGAFAAALVGFSFSGLPPVLHVLLCMLAAAIAGGLFALIPGILKGLLDVNEMVVTIMLNYVAVLFIDHLTNTTFYSGEGFSATHKIAESAALPRLFPYSQLNGAFFIALLLVAAVWFIFRRTVLGYKIKAMGHNIRFAEACGMQTRSSVVKIMVLSGILAGIAGSGEVLGVHGRFIAGFSPGYGWDGMTIALLGQLNPLGVLIAALFFGVLKNGGSTMELMIGVPRSIISIIQGLMIFFLAVDYINSRFDLFGKFRKKKNRVLCLED